MNRAFVAAWQAKTGQRITVNMSHGGSGTQARAVLDARGHAGAGRRDRETPSARAGLAVKTNAIRDGRPRTLLLVYGPAKKNWR